MKDDDMEILYQPGKGNVVADGRLEPKELCEFGHIYY